MMAATFGEYARTASGQSTTKHSSYSPELSEDNSGEAYSFPSNANYADPWEAGLLACFPSGDLPYEPATQSPPILEEPQHLSSAASSDECLNDYLVAPEHSGSEDIDRVIVHVRNTGIADIIHVQHGQRTIETDTLRHHLHRMLGFSPELFLVKTDSGMGDMKWNVPDGYVRLPACGNLHVSVELPPRASLIPLITRELLSYRPAPVVLPEPSLPEPPSQITSVRVPQAEVWPCDSVQPPNRRSPVSPLPRSGSNSPPPLQTKEALDCLYEWMREQNLFDPQDADLSMPPWQLIGWQDDPREAERHPNAREWCFVGPLRFRVENGLWKRNLHTDAPPLSLQQSRWMNRSKPLAKTLQVANKVTGKTHQVSMYKRYFRWQAGSTPEGKLAAQRWKDWKWLLYEEVPAEVVNRQTFHVAEVPVGGPDYLGLFTLKLQRNVKGEQGVGPAEQFVTVPRGAKRGPDSDRGQGGRPRLHGPDSVLNSYFDRRTDAGSPYDEEEGAEWPEDWDAEDEEQFEAAEEEWGGGGESEKKAGEEEPVADVEGAAGPMAPPEGEAEKGKDAAEELVAEMKSLDISSSGTASSSSSSSSSGPREFLPSELVTVTRGFSEKLEEANEDFYDVFKGTVDGTGVAVKRGRIKISPEAFDEMKRKQALISHRNLASVMGFCADADCQALVFALPKGQSLHTRLYGERGPDNPILSWPERLTCAVHMLSALEYLHKKHAMPHGRISSRNVFLEPSGSALLTNWMVPGLAALVGRVYEGSDEYLSASEYYNAEFYGGQPDRLSDVSALGMLLLELIAGRGPYNSSLPADQARLLPWAHTCFKEKDMSKFVDKELLPLLDNTELTQAMRLTRLALRCTQRDRTARPTLLEAMSKVLGIVENMSRSPVGNLGEEYEVPSEQKVEMSPPRELADKVPEGLYGLQGAVFDASRRNSTS